ncbi:recombination and repair protein RecT [Bifidobacterium bombi DSM 19703]|uniref:Recombination and repair protein RecT n=2 Tax=Bifidobacterium bombi TaxID=471511 RepID=A0A080N6J1_9BIFI|nr:recombination and repair protein RecT [Bifidobacterium bombi DSM 19703]
MGELTQQTQSRGLQTKSPTGKLKTMLEKSWPRIQAVIGNNMSGERLYQLCVSTINKNPKLADCTPESVLSCFMQCSALGLEPSDVDGLGRAYILPYGNGRNGRTQATFILGYKGIIDLARRSGQIKSIHAQAVYEGDDFECWEDETGQHFKYRQNPNASHEPGKLTDVFVNAQLMTGGFVFEHMTRSEVDRIRARSKARNNGPWASDYEAMAKKTVIRRVFPYLPVSVNAQQAVNVDESTPDYREIFHPIVEQPSTPTESTQIEGEVVEENTSETKETFHSDDGDSSADEQNDPWTGKEAK